MKGTITVRALRVLALAAMAAIPGLADAQGIPMLVGTWKGTAYAVSVGSNPYRTPDTKEPNLPSDALEFTYPPFAGLVMSPMALLPFGAVVVIAVIATVLTTALLTWWFAGPLLRRLPGPIWFPLGVACCLALVFEPVRETITFGQVNTLLLTLVAGDMLLGVARGRRWAGIGIGLATAVKLTPGVFIVYRLLVGAAILFALAGGYVSAAA